MKIRYAFVSAYTAKGYCSFLSSWLRKLRQIIVLTGMPGSGKSTFIRKMGLQLAERGYEVQFWSSPLDSAYLQGLFLPQLSTAVVDGDWPDLGWQRHPGQAVNRVDLGDYSSSYEELRSREEVRRLGESMEHLMFLATTGLMKAGRDEKESKPKERRLMDSGALKDLEERLSEEILGWRPGEAHYFAGVITAEGKIDYHEEILKDCLKRYILKGPFAWVKSRLMLSLGKEALNLGHKVSFYHSGLDPERLEMMVIDTLKVAVVDGDAADLAAKADDREISLATCLEPDEVSSKGLEDRDKADGPIWAEIYHAVEKLKKVREAEEKLARFVTRSMAFEKIDDRRDELLKEILSETFA